jgi:hypothetical protein
MLGRNLLRDSIEGSVEWREGWGLLEMAMGRDKAAWEGVACCNGGLGERGGEGEETRGEEVRL